jgi:hypothetical protein
MLTSYAMLDRQRRAVLKRIAAVGPFMMGTVTMTHNKSTVSGKREDHFAEKMYVTWTEKGNTSGSQYITKELREDVEAWIANYWELKGCMEEMTQLSRQMISLYVRTQKGKRTERRTS